ncbi:MAG TPA: hypothetical protein VJH24_03175 [Candidatus Bilamarchaeaceae archaeon]|nr:hypothetical protein [Candidatus Bilamarchaeaceae archaeon]
MKKKAPKKVEKVEEKEEGVDFEAVADLVRAKCTMRSVLTAGNKRKCRSSPPKDDRCIAEIVTKNTRNSNVYGISFA